MEITYPFMYYGRVFWRAGADFVQSFGLWTLPAAIICIGAGCVAHIALVRVFPSLKNRLGEPMTRWWIWIVYTLVPLGCIALVLAMFNLIMAPPRLYYALENKPVPQPVGDPRDAADIKTLTRQLIESEGERDRFKTASEESERNRRTVESERDAMRSQLDDRDKKMKLREELVAWRRRVVEMRSQVESEQPPTDDEWKAFAAEVAEFANHNLDASQRASLSSYDGLFIPQGMVKIREEGVRRNVTVHGLGACKTRVL